MITVLSARKNSILSMVGIYFTPVATIHCGCWRIEAARPCPETVSAVHAGGARRPLDDSGSSCGCVPPAAA